MIHLGINVRRLTDEHLLDERTSLLAVLVQLLNKLEDVTLIIPETLTIDNVDVFLRNKMLSVYLRHSRVCREITRRNLWTGSEPTMSEEMWQRVPKGYWHTYSPTASEKMMFIEHTEDLIRLSSGIFHYEKKAITSDQAISLLYSPIKK